MTKKYSTGFTVGVWSTWSAYSPCSVTCENGVEQRTRVCTHNTLPDGVANCAGAETDERTCSLPACYCSDTFTEVNGADLQEVGAIGSANGCQDLCRGRPDCNSWEWAPVTRRCILSAMDYQANKKSSVTKGAGPRLCG